jgi:DNA-binding HxlR family transcriptional regulator
MLPREYQGQQCSIARTLEVVGDRWTLLVLRDAFNRTRRFEDFQRSLGVARNVLTDRLNRLVEEGLLEKRPYQENPPRYEYRLTEKALDLWPAMIALMRWGDRYLAPEGPPWQIIHRECGGDVTERLRCERCGADLGPRDVVRKPGPGLRAA